MTTYYKIRYRDNPTLFVKGTPMYLTTDKTGRTFQSLGALRTFLTSVMNCQYESVRGKISEWEIVELEVTEKAVKGIHEIITAKKLKELIMK